MEKKLSVIISVICIIDLFQELSIMLKTIILRL